MILYLFIIPVISILVFIRKKERYRGGTAPLEQKCSKNYNVFIFRLCNH